MVEYDCDACGWSYDDDMIGNCNDCGVTICLDCLISEVDTCKPCAVKRLRVSLLETMHLGWDGLKGEIDKIMVYLQEHIGVEEIYGESWGDEDVIKQYLEDYPSVAENPDAIEGKVVWTT